MSPFPSPFPKAFSLVLVFSFSSPFAFPASLNLGDVHGCLSTMVLATVDQVGGGRLSASLGVLAGGEESPKVIVGRIFLDVKEDMLTITVAGTLSTILYPS